ncbi:MAG: hypothetical protein DRI65_01360 [Chloroflexota bacterium]|nr:MAG: hypothetical protein DRI65_01360 [Chloroflexota bacterium]HDD56088.1 hypothetical protein [Chloroflexota bacterium]
MSEETKTPKTGQIPQEAKDHFGTARKEFKKGLDAMFPPRVKEHHQAAQREVLQGLRSLIDAALEKLEEYEE